MSTGNAAAPGTCLPSPQNVIVMVAAVNDQAGFTPAPAQEQTPRRPDPDRPRVQLPEPPKLEPPRIRLRNTEQLAEERPERPVPPSDRVTLKNRDPAATPEPLTLDEALRRQDVVARARNIPQDTARNPGEALDISVLTPPNAISGPGDETRRRDVESGSIREIRARQAAERAEREPAEARRRENRQRMREQLTNPPAAAQITAEAERRRLAQRLEADRRADRAALEEVGLKNPLQSAFDDAAVFEKKLNEHHGEGRDIIRRRNTEKAGDREQPEPPPPADEDRRSPPDAEQARDALQRETTPDDTAQARRRENAAAAAAELLPDPPLRQPDRSPGPAPEVTRPDAVADTPTPDEPPQRPLPGDNTRGDTSSSVLPGRDPQTDAPLDRGDNNGALNGPDPFADSPTQAFLKEHGFFSAAPSELELITRDNGEPNESTVIFEQAVARAQSQRYADEAIAEDERLEDLKRKEDTAPEPVINDPTGNNMADEENTGLAPRAEPLRQDDILYRATLETQRALDQYNEVLQVAGSKNYDLIIDLIS